MENVIANITGAPRFTVEDPPHGHDGILTDEHRVEAS